MFSIIKNGRYTRYMLFNLTYPLILLFFRKNFQVLVPYTVIISLVRKFGLLKNNYFCWLPLSYRISDDYRVTQTKNKKTNFKTHKIFISYTIVFVQTIQTKKIFIVLKTSSNPGKKDIMQYLYENRESYHYIV